ncbi:YdhK family protein [Salirhabdus sp. Marseille-P4669]|uniref:YdhK family protein n=1 Tax=Salirhabdus sp. Marseille-P4669 TaxID=2042310 RepID=UPI000C7ABBA1|nr:YdhK family protein [Salirhabdus sp. Marseille-P4669]
MKSIYKWPAMFIFVLLLTACTSTTDDNDGVDPDTGQQYEENEGTEGTESDQDGEHSHSGEAPENLKQAEDPTYPIGSTAIIEADHMEGMNGAEATIVGAYDTTVYAVTYTPTSGGEKVENHKWVVHEELEDAGDAPLEPGTEVTLNAKHMIGMDGATAVIESAEQTTVYMINYVSKKSGEEIKNHMWVTEDELKAK